MAIRGENIGTAYIRILADGGRFDESVRDQMDDIPWEKYGRKANEEWREGWIEEASKSANQRTLRESISKPLARGNWLTEEFFRGKNWERFRSGLRNEFGDAGERAGEHFEERLLEGMSFSQLNRELDNLVPLLKKKQQEIQKELHEADMAQRRDLDRDLERHWQNLADQFGAIWEEAHEENRKRDLAAYKQRLDLDREWELHIEDLARQEREIREEQQRLQRLGAMQAAAYREDERRAMVARIAELERLRQLYQLVGRESGQLFSGDRTTMGRENLLRSIRQIRADMERLNYENLVWNDVLGDTERRLTYLNPTLNRHRLMIGRIADASGRAFGRGSRNDFLNLIGSMVRGFVNLGQVAPATLQFFSRWGRSINEAEDGLGKLKATFGPLGKGLGTLAGAFVGLTVVIGPLVSILSLAAGAVVALASSITMGLVGAVGALGGAMLPVIATIGTLILAFQNMPKEAKVAFRSLKSEFEGLGEVAGEAVFFNITEQAERFRGILGDLETPLRKVGRAISRVGDYWLDLMEGEGFTRFRDAMERFLPDAVESLGRALGDLFGGMGGVLRGLIPLTTRFLDWLERSARKFNEWANSARGQTAIRDFFEDAGDAAAQLGDFLGAVNDLFWELVRAGDDAGNGLFASMTDTINGWVRTLQSNPDILRNWFDSAERFGRALGRVIVAFGELLGALDNMLTREAVIAVFQSLGGAIGLVADAIEGVGSLFGDAAPQVAALATQAAIAAAVLPRLNGAMATVRGTAGGFITNLRNAETRTAALGRAARGAAGIGGMVALMQSTQETSGAMKAFTGIAGAALMGFAVGGPWGAAIGAGVGALGALIGHVEGMTKETENAIPKLGEFAATMDTVTGATTQATRALVLQKLEQQGLVAETRQFGISARDLVSAVLGEKDAIDRVNTALSSKTDLLGGLTASGVREKLGLLGREFSNEARQVKDAAEATTSWKDALQGLPKKVGVAVKNLGMDATIQEVATLALQYELTPKEIRTVIKALGVDGTLKDVRNVQKELDETGRKRPTPKVDLDPAQFNSKNDMTLAKLKKLDLERPIPKANLDTEALVDKVLNVGTRLDNLDGKRPKPIADLNDKVSSPLGRLTDRLNFFGQMRKDATVGINDQATGKIQTIKSMISSITGKTVTITTEYISTGSGKIPRTATGGTFNYPNVRLIGEAGPEAVVPLSRPLNQVDPSVRWLSAIAQGKVPAMASGGVVGGGKTINVGGIQVTAPSADPVVVAEQVVNRLAASGY